MARPSQPIGQLLHSRCPGNVIANQTTSYNGTRAIATGHSLFPRVPWVMERVPATRIDELRPLRIDIKHKKEHCNLPYGHKFDSSVSSQLFGNFHPGAFPTGQAQQLKLSHTALSVTCHLNTYMSHGVYNSKKEWMTLPCPCR